MNFEQCLKAFEGNCKEIYVVETENVLAGFVIIQTCGTFSGYIQTICIDELYRGKGFGEKILKFCEKTILKFSPNALSVFLLSIKVRLDFIMSLVLNWSEN